MKTPTRVLLVRHGQTALNAEGRLRGLADPELDEIGIKQARDTATALRPVGLGRVLSSPLRRAVATARMIAEASEVEHHVDAGFNDRDYGPWTGRIKSEVIQQWGSINAAPGVESEAIVLARALGALNALLTTEEQSTIAVVTHDAVIRPLLRTFQPGANPEVQTGSWAELAHSADGWRVLTMDNMA